MENQINKSDIIALTKGNFIVYTYFHQYAEGITGSNISQTIYTNNGTGFKTKKEAKLVVKEMKLNHQT